MNVILLQRKEFHCHKTKVVLLNHEAIRAVENLIQI